MAKALVKVGDKVMATGGKLLTAESGSLLKPILDATKSSHYLFSGYQDESVDSSIRYEDTENVENFNYMFFNASNLTHIPSLNTSKGTSFQNTFEKCRKIENIPLLDTSNGTKFYSCFCECNSLVEIPNLDFSKGVDLGQLFFRCYKLAKLPRLDTSNADSFTQSFASCNTLQKVDISKLASNRSYATNYMFESCYNLKAFIIRSFGETYMLNSNSFNYCYRMLHQANSIHNPNNTEDGYIYVPRDMIPILEQETNWSAFAEQFIALEEFIIPNEDGTIDLINGEFNDKKAGISYD